MPKTIESWGVGRKDNSKAVESSVIPTVMSHQTKITRWKTKTVTLAPGEEVTIVNQYPLSWSGKKFMDYFFRILTDSNFLFLTGLFYSDLDKILEKSDYNYYAIKTYGWQYGYGKVVFSLAKGIPIDFIKDMPVSIYYPNDYFKYCISINLLNISNETRTFNLTYENFGFLSREPWW